MPKQRITSDDLVRKMAEHFTSGANPRRSQTITTEDAATQASPTSANPIAAIDTSAGAVTYTLPSAVGHAGARRIVKKITGDANAVTVATTSSQTIDGATTYSLTAQWESITVQSNGANWLIVATV